MSISYKKTIIGVIGASATTNKLNQLCESLGAAIAGEGWVTLTGGEPAGVMEYTLKGAAEAGGETIGILGGTRSDQYSNYATVPVFTGADIARDYFNVLTADVIVLVGEVSAGTLIEVAYALKRAVPIIMLAVPSADAAYIAQRGGALVAEAEDVEGVVQTTREVLQKK